MDTPHVIYEDGIHLVLDKPTGWVVNESNTTNNLTLQDWISKNYDFETSQSRELRSGIVHRLDKETSGVILVAKTKSAFEELQRQFKERSVQKTYIALVHGRVESETGKINAPTGRLPWKRTKFGVWEGGRSAQTDYKVVKSYDDYSLLELYPKTGRTHQIRVHLKYINHPIVGDYLYAGRKTAREDRKWCPRMFLHAAKININGRIYEAPLPATLNDALETLGDLHAKHG